MIVCLNVTLQPVQGVTLPSLNHSWETLQQNLVTLSAGILSRWMGASC